MVGPDVMKRPDLGRSIAERHIAEMNKVFAKFKTKISFYLWVRHVPCQCCAGDHAAALICIFLYALLVWMLAGRLRD